MNPVRALRSPVIEAARYPSLYQIQYTCLVNGVVADARPAGDARRRRRRRARSPRGIGGSTGSGFLACDKRARPHARSLATNAEWRHEFQDTLPDLREEDIAGSGFAITGYTAHSALGGDSALARIRQRLRGRGLRLMLDFVPNHTAPDHPWVEEHRDYYVAGTEFELAQAPQNYTRVRLRRGDKVLALGRDPYFAVGPTRCSSITAIRRPKKRCVASSCGLPGSASSSMP
jgi:hypothetical protein